MAKSTLPTPELTGEAAAPTEVYKLTAAQVKTLLNRMPKGTRFAISAGTSLSIEGDDSSCYPGHACLVVGYTIALKYAEECLLHFEDRGARISVFVYPHVGDAKFVVVG